MTTVGRVWLLVYVYLGLLKVATGTPTLETNRRVPVEGLPLEITCKLSTSSPSLVTFTAGSSITANCPSWSSGTCDITDSSAYSTRYTTSPREVILTIQSFNGSRDDQIWYCTHDSQSNSRNLTSSSSVLDWDQVSLTPDPFPDSVNSTASVVIFLTTPCARGRVTVTGTYTDQNSASDSLPQPNNRPNSCSNNEESRTVVYSVLGNSPIMQGKRIRVNISVEHDSFSPSQGYTLSLQRGPLQFPVAVQSVTMRNITSDGETLKILENRTIVLVCESSPSFPDATIQWYYRHTPSNESIASNFFSSQTEVVRPVVTKTISTLTLIATKSSSTRMISCEATNSVTQQPVSSLKATIDVLYPPTGPSLSPQSGSLLENRSVTLTCTSSDRGNPECSYSWSKNNVVQSTGSTYILTPAKDDNGKKITCQAINEYTTTASTTLTSSEYRLNVYYAPRVSITPSSITRKEGDSLDLTCTADSNPTSQTFVWSSSLVSTLFTSSRWTMSNLSRDDHGIYTCTVTVAASSHGQLSSSATVQVTVNYAPDINMTDMNIQEGQSLTIPCRAMGRPESYNFEFFKQYWGNTDIRSLAGSKSGSTYTLSRSRATYRDSGQYECGVNNGIANRTGVLVQTKRITVTVQASPVFIGGTTSFAAEIGQMANITQNWYSNSGMISRVTSYINGSSVSLSSSVITTSLTLNIYGKNVQAEGYMVTLQWNKVKAADFGTYIITPCNNAGCRNITVWATPSGPPLEPLEFTSVNSSAESVWLRWKPNFPGGNSNQYFDLYYRVRGSGANWTMETISQGSGAFTYKRVLGLQLGTEYTFKLQSRNRLPTKNKGPFTGEIYVKTKDLNGGIAVGVGIGVGASIGLFLLVAVAAGLIYKFRRQIQGISLPCKRGKESNSDEQPNQEEEGETNYAGLETGRGKSHHNYEGIALKPIASSSAGSTDGDNPYMNFKGAKPAVMPKPKKGKNMHHDRHIYQNTC